MCMLSHFSCVQLFVTLWIIAFQGPLCMRILQARISEWVAIPSSRRFFLTEGLNSHLLHLHCRRVLYLLSYQGHSLHQQVGSLALVPAGKPDFMDTCIQMAQKQRVTWDIASFSLTLSAGAGTSDPEQMKSLSEVCKAPHTIESI